LSYARTRSFDAVFCHGSRANLPAVKLLRIPLIALADYEYAALPKFMVGWTTLLLIPDVIPKDVFARRGVPIERIQGYPGLKEDLYVHDFQPDPAFLHKMGINPENILVLVRPPATMAHYAVKESGVLFYQILDDLCKRPDVQILLLPRTDEQATEMSAYVNTCKYRNAIIPREVLNGPNLVWHSDIVVSGGGTMNREAASLNVPVISIYQGHIGAVDRYLIEAGKLTHIKTIAEFREIHLRKSDRKNTVRHKEIGERACCHIVDRIVQVGGGNNCRSLDIADQPSALPRNGTV
jgi:uncharacterized protein